MVFLWSIFWALGLQVTGFLVGATILEAVWGEYGTVGAFMSARCGWVISMVANVVLVLVAGVVFN